MSARNGRERIEERLARRGGWIELLRGPAALYAAAMRLRRSWYARGVLPARRVAGAVVSVGNLTVGGTGKTPFVAFLARELEQRGRRVGLLSRGYGARAAGGERNEEAIELERRLGVSVPHVQNPDRVAGARELLAAGVDVVLLDDGFQHRRLARDLDLVLVDATRPFGLPLAGAQTVPVEALLPRGLLREPPEALREAHACVITRCDQVDESALARLEARLDLLAPGVPLLRARHRPARLAGLDGSAHDLDRLRGARVAALSAIGNARAFRRTLEDLGAIVASERADRDHASFGAADEAFVRAAGERGETVVVTAKDAPKLERLLPAELRRATRVLFVELELLRGASVLAALLDALPSPRGSSHG